ncbi:glycerophosphodiester phosphodiesterase [Nocardioides nematodiphilus]|uniref:glycerophosphodiester phosphodiesterase n=1 Tax=Nocardioides nematodiphilus TaxID=2849669 RepID=UPI001CD97563|nr:glycerophosphodiester phosphodiesterase [Nocardioides nematodiphilus]MCA1981902.1 glycerophosphodiester phosphodiesterase [Nocardioides nematodiphilus]
MVLISAHRCGAGDDPASQNGLHALEHSLSLRSAAGGVDYVEFDVRRLTDGTLVVTHDEPGDGVELLPYASVLERLAGRAGAHIDLKAEGYEIEATEGALRVIPADRIVVTTGSVIGARRLRDWADLHGHPIRVGLSTGTSLSGLPPLRALVSLRRQLFPWRRYAAARADVLCAHHVLAAITLRRLAARRGLDLLVWTVDDTRLLRWWLRPGRAWMVTTNHPARALDVRAPERMPS